MSRREAKRGAYRKRDCVFVGVWIPKGWLPIIDSAVKRTDLDRSKLVRKAVSEALGPFDQ